MRHSAPECPAAAEGGPYALGDLQATGHPEDSIFPLLQRQEVPSAAYQQSTQVPLAYEVSLEKSAIKGAVAGFGFLKVT